MKHIKLFEDYSEEELRNLQDDLHDVGHKAKFVRGEDFGFGEDLNQNCLYNYPTMTKEMVDFLLKKGEIKRVDWNNYFHFKNPEKFGMIPDEEYPTYPEIIPVGTKEGLYFIDYNLGPDESPEKQTLAYNEIMKKLGEIRI